MSILIDKSTRLIVQGITGRDGLFHARKMKEYGTNVVGGTSPGKGGTDANGIPVFFLLFIDIVTHYDFIAINAASCIVVAI